MSCLEAQESLGGGQAGSHLQHEPPLAWTASKGLSVQTDVTCGQPKCLSTNFLVGRCQKGAAEQGGGPEGEETMTNLTEDGGRTGS